MDYFRGIVKAIIPRKAKDIIAVSMLLPAMLFVGWKVVLQEPPSVQVRTETTYPKEAHRNGFFYLNFDLRFGAACLVSARRVIIGNDGVEYLAQEDTKEVVKDQFMKYTVRIPVAPSVPLGPAYIRSDFEYGCDWWSRHVWPIKNQGRLRAVTILPEKAEAKTDGGNDVASLCALPHEPGMVRVKAHYRKVRGSTASANLLATGVNVR